MRSGDDNTGHASGGLARAERVLRSIRASARVQLLLQRAGLILAYALAAALGAGLLDFVLRPPMGLRLVLLALGASGVGVLLWRWIVPAARFAPDLTELALRVERLEEAKQAGLRGRLASGLELSRRADESTLEGSLSAEAARETARRFETISGRVRLGDPHRLRRTLLALVAIGVPVAALTAWAPMMLRIGAARVLTPWADVSWPKRTGVADASRPVAHAIDAALPLRAAVTRTSHPPGRTDVAVRYRLIVNGREGPLHRAMLTPQRRTVEVETPGAAPVSGELYERLLEPAALSAAEQDAGASIELEYWFETEDDRTPAWRTVLVHPPAVLSASVTVDPPAYASDVLAGRTDIARGERDAGNGRDERATISPILGGSRVTLALTLNKEVPTPSERGQLAAFLAGVAPGLDRQAGLSAGFNGTSWRISWDSGAPLRVPIVLRDQFGIESNDPAVFRFETVEDRPPTAAVIEPGQDESVLATAVIDAVGEGRDDVALSWTMLTRQVARPPAGSAGAPPDPVGEPMEASRADATPGTPATRLRAAASVSMPSLGVAPGDEVRLVAKAGDIFAQHDASRSPAVSSTRRLRIITESEFVEQLRAELAGVREAAKRLVQDQARLASDRPKAAGDPAQAGEQRERQEGLGGRMPAMGEVIARVQRRTERNGLEDRALAGLLQDAAGALSDAQAASAEAERALGRLQARAQGQAASPDEQAAARAQEQVGDALTQLADMLDRGQDTWAVRRTLEKLISDQKQTTAQTRAAGGQTQGLSPEQLTQQQREDLARVSRRQEELSQRTAALTEQLEHRSEEVQKNDPGQAQAMQAAAQRARGAGVVDKQHQAGEQVAQNQTSQAQQLQEQAEQALEQMAQELDKSEQRRDEALRRMLADLLRSIDGLIRDQEHELGRLGEASAGHDAGTLDTPMISLNRNTLATAQTAREQSREAGKVADLLDSAGTSQSAAIVAIRLPDYPEADANERQSLRRLREAGDEAKKLDEEAAKRDQDRKRAELLKAYREALELQSALNAETAPLLGKEPDRRERVAARRLGERQDEIRASLQKLREQTSEVADSGMFDFAHQRLDTAAREAGEMLARAETSPGVGVRQQTIARVLHALVEALKQDQQDKDAFREGDEGGGGGGGGGAGGNQPLIPPIAELKLLRMMQEEAFDRTRLADSENREAAEVASLQRELNRKGEELLEKLSPPHPEEEQAPPEEPAPEPPPHQEGTR